jgi:hypothetical protein
MSNVEGMIFARVARTLAVKTKIADKVDNPSPSFSHHGQ